MEPGNTVAFRLPRPPRLNSGRSTSLCRRTSSEWPSSLGGLIAPVGRKIECPTPARYQRRRDVDRCECSSGRVGSLKATASFVALRLPTLPGERYPQTGQNLFAEILGRRGVNCLAGIPASSDAILALE